MNSLLSVLTVRPFFFLFLSEVFSQVAMNMFNFVLIIIVYQLTNSNTAVSGVILSYTIPSIILGIPAGVIVDRMNKKTVLFSSNFIRAFFLLLLVINLGNVALIYTLSFLIAIATQFFIPAESPMIPVLVKKQQLLSANALFGMGIYGSVLIAYALSGPLLILYGKISVLIILSLSFLIAAIFVSAIRVPKREQEKVFEKEKAAFLASVHPIKSFMSELRLAMDVIRKTKTIYHSLLLLTLSQILILTLAVIGPGFAKQVLRISVDQFPLLFVTPAALGMVIGGVVIANFLQKITHATIANVGVFVSGIGILLLPLLAYTQSSVFSATSLATFSGLHVVILAAFILGFANALVFVPSNTIVQEETSDNVRGKVYGALNALVGAFSLLPVILVGGLADVFGVRELLSWIGISLVIIGIIRVVLLRQSGKHRK